MKKILYFLDYPLDLLGGAQLSTASICDCLSGTNYCPVVVTPRLMSRDSNYSYRIVEYDLTRENKITKVFERMLVYRKIIKTEKPDIIHVQMPLSAMIIGILKKFGLAGDNKFIFTDRALLSGYSKKSRFLLSIVSKKMDRIVCTTEINKCLWSKTIDSQNVIVIPNTVSPKFIEGCKSCIKEQKESNDEIVIGFAGRVTEFKNWPLSLEICKHLKNTRIPFCVYCVLSAYIEDEKELMHSYINELKTLLGEDHFKYWIDLQQEKMPEFYSKLDVFILTSTFESFGKTAIEAMCCNCSVISTAVGGLLEVVEKKENLFAIDDVDGFVKKIALYHSNKNLLNADKEYFYNRFKHNYDLSINEEKHLELYAVV